MEAVTRIPPVRREKRAFDPPPPAPAATKPEVPDVDTQRAIIFDNRPRSGGNSPQCEDGNYRVKLVSVTEDDNPFHAKDGKSARTRRVWRFTVVTDDLGGELRYYSSLSFGPRLEQALAALGVRLAKNDTTTVDPNDLIGRECNARLENVQTERGTYPRIKQLFPILS
jgi:hypothetical protein